MFERIDESELLGWIEDELPADRAAAVRAALAASPEALAHAERLRRDRVLMQSIGEAPLPVDLVAELEPLLAKPMLLETGAAFASPGTYRARHRRAGIRRASRMLLAAGFTLALTAGLIGFILRSGLLTMSADDASDGTIARNDETSPPGTGGDLAPPALEGRLASGDVHHWDALPDITLAARGGFTPPAPGAVNSDPTLTLASGARAIESRFALVIANSRERQQVIDRMKEMVAEVGDAAFVRNFTYDEAARAWNDLVASARLADRERWRTAMSRRGAEGQFDVGLKRDIRHVAQHVTTTLGEHLAGRPDLAAPPDEQLRLVDAGASMALTLPATDLIDFLVEIDRAFGRVVTLQPVVGMADSGGSSSGAAPTPPGNTAVDEWTRWRQWREAIDTFQRQIAADESLMIVLPVAGNHR